MAAALVMVLWQKYAYGFVWLSVFLSNWASLFLRAGRAFGHSHLVLRDDTIRVNIEIDRLLAVKLTTPATPANSFTPISLFTPTDPTTPISSTRPDIVNTTALIYNIMEIGNSD
ncbi:hypothetical protein GE21DRAFT_1275266 [Neurospora crassa]|nr:hypothetical protein GE21DRAFT_1275266 [Neurospora crassa]